MPDPDKLDPSVFDSTQPDGNSDPRLGDNFIRDVKARLFAWGTREHNPDGKHKIPVAASTPTPDATAIGQLVIKTTDEELYANIAGGAFVKMTSKSEVIALQGVDTSHAASNPAGHVAGSIRNTHILAGEIKKKHVVAGSGDPDGSVAGLVNGSMTTLHSHATGLTAQTPIVYTSGNTFSDPDAAFILVECWGGGGGGGNGGGGDYGGSGGGGGAYAGGLIFAVGIGALAITVATSVTSGTNGGISSCGGIITAGGGLKGNPEGAVGIGGAGSNNSSEKLFSFRTVPGGSGGAYAHKSGGGGGGCAGSNGAPGVGEFGTPGAAGGVGANGGGDGGTGGGNTGGPPTDGGIPGGGGGGATSGVVNAGGGVARGQVRGTVYK